MTGLDAAAAFRDPAALLLLLHGGKVSSYEPVRRGNLAALRMSALARALGPGLGLPILTLRNRYRGWNDKDGARTPSPVRDALWALETIEQRLGPTPVILVGHSLGGRTAVRVAHYPTVRAVAALAPWLPLGEPADPLNGRRVIIAHGLRDKVTDPEHSVAFAERASTVADTVWLKLVDDGHALLRAPATWNGLVRDFATLAAHGPRSEGLDAEWPGLPGSAPARLRRAV